MDKAPRSDARTRRRWVSGLDAVLFGLSWKLMAPYLVLTAAFAILGTFLVTRLVTGSLEERFNNQLLESSRTAADSLVRAERKQLESVRAISFADGVAAAMEQRSPAELERIVTPFAVNGHVRRVEVLGSDGRRIFGLRLSESSAASYAATQVADDFADWPMVAAVLAGQSDGTGDKYVGIVNDRGEWTLFTSSPVLDDAGVAGAILVGTPIQDILAATKLEALADLALFSANGMLVGTTFPDVVGVGAALRPVVEGLGEAPARRQASLSGREYELLYADLRLREQPAGRYAVALPSDYIASAGSTARTQMALLFAGITVSVVILGWGLARMVTRPLHQLLATTQAVTAGDLTARTRVVRRDEIGALARGFDLMTEKLQRQQLATIGALTSAIDARDPYTAGHSMRVGKLCVELGSALGLAPTSLQHLEIGGYLHDIGKIGVRDSVLLKPGSLTPEERRIIECHPQIGLEILKRVELPSEVVALVGGHHEKLDGSGYPLRLKGDEVTIFPRIAAVADMYDALTTSRPYRAAMTIDEALALLERERGEGRIDPEVLRVLRYVVPQWEERRRDDPLLEGYRMLETHTREAA